MTRRIAIAAAWLMLGAFQACLPPSSARAADAAPPKQDDAAKAAPAGRSGAEDRVLAFVDDHQPELAKVLAHLERRKPDEYAKAIAELASTVAALETTKGKDERLHELELKAWQARTNVDLLVARWMAVRKKERADVEKKLHAAVAAEMEVRAEQLVYRKQRSAAWYDRQIERLRERQDELVAARLKSLLADAEEKPKAAPADPR